MRHNLLAAFATVTFSPEHATADVADARRHLRNFFRRLETAATGGAKFPYVYVLEVHGSGVVHVHLLLPRWATKALVAKVWGELGEQIDSRTVLAAGHLDGVVDYMLKDPATKRAYETAHGEDFQPEVTKVKPVDSIAEGRRAAIELMGSEPDREVLHRVNGITVGVTLYWDKQFEEYWDTEVVPFLDRSDWHRMADLRDRRRAA